jgi:hypothetical protein
MQGRNAHGAAIHQLEPGDYVKRTTVSDGDTREMWWFCSPNGVLGRLVMPEDSPQCHHIEQHEDGAISVLPQEGNTNSILAKDGFGNEWHGWIRHGVWESI